MTRENADAAFKGFAKAKKHLQVIQGTAVLQAFGNSFELFKLRESGTGCNISFGDDVIYIAQRDDPQPWEFKADRSNMYMFDAVITLFMYPREAELMIEGLRARLHDGTT